MWGFVVCELIGSPCRARATFTMSSEGVAGTPALDAVTRSPSLRLGRWRRRREAVASHDLGHPGAIGRPAGGRIDHLGSLAEILRTDRRGRDDAERRRVLASVVVEPVDGDAWKSEGMPGSDVER